MASYLHNHSDFEDLLRILEGETKIQAALIEKDYWIMHVLYGLKSQGFSFELKGGTSLSKAHNIIHRFSEDIDIHINPPDGHMVEQDVEKKKSASSRKTFFDWLAKEININGIISVERDTAFDDLVKYRNGGIRLNYKSFFSSIAGVKEGILLEVGFDNVAPNSPVTITSWAFDKASSVKSIDLIDNRAAGITCYHAGYTFVEKLQTIATKFRNEVDNGKSQKNYMRQYYDVYCLLDHAPVLEFIGSPEYHAHKKLRFPQSDYEVPIKNNEAFLLSDNKLREIFIKRYKETASLYYKGQPDFEELMDRIAKHAHLL